MCLKIITILLYHLSLYLQQLKKINMNALKYTLVTTLLPFSLMAQNKMAPEKISSPPVIIKTSMDSCSYAMGMSIATDLKARGVNELNYDLFAKALVDGFAGTNTVFSKEEMQKAISNYLSQAKKSKAEGVLEEGQKFLAENKVKKGVITLPSGLQYLVLKQGTGAKPKVKDDVTVHYEGKLLNGYKFDSSYDRKEPIDLNLSQVIPGWTEGLQQMQVGSKYRLFIPWELGYGAEGAGDIPPYSVLVFDIELLKIGK